MQLLYNSDSYAVVQIELPGADADVPAGDAGEAGQVAARRGGYEIVDKLARKEVFLAGALAQQFEAGVKALVAESKGEGVAVEALDEYISGYTVLAQQPVLLH